MSALVSNPTLNRPRCLSHTSETSLVGLNYVYTTANVNGSSGDSPNSRSHQIGQENSYSPPNAKANALQMVKPQPQYLSSNRQQQTSIENNTAEVQNANTGHASWTRNPRAPMKHSYDSTPSQYHAPKKMKEDDQPLHDHATPSDNPILSDQKDDQRKHLILPQLIRRNLSSVHLQKPNIVNHTKEPEDPLHNRVITAKTWTPTAHQRAQSSLSVGDGDCHHNDDSHRPSSGASCVSSLSADESHVYLSDITSVAQHLPPIRIMNSDVHERHDFEMHQIGEEHVGTNDHSPYNEHDLTLNRDDGVPHHLTFMSPTKPRTYSAASTVERRNYPLDASQSRERISLTTDDNDLNREELPVPTHLQHLPQGSDVKSLELNQPPPYTQHIISTSSTPCAKPIIGRSIIQQRDDVHSTVARDSSNDSSNNNTSIMKKFSCLTNHHQKKKITPRCRSSTRLPILDALPPTHVRSISTSAASLTSTTISSSQYESYKRNKHYRNHTYDRSIGGGSNSIASASYGSAYQPSITVNGKVRNDVKHRRVASDTACLILGGSRGMGDDIIKHDRNSIYEAAIMGKLSGLEVTTALESQSVAAQSSLESCPSILKYHSTVLGDDATMKSYGGSTIGITSVSSGTTAQGKRRRMKRRSMKDEVKYFVGKMVPTPLRGLRGVLTRQKSVDLERSKGCLT